MYKNKEEILIDNIEPTIGSGEQGQARRYEGVVRILGKVRKKVFLNELIVFLQLLTN